MEEHPIDTILIQDLCQILCRPFEKKEKRSNKISVTVKDDRILILDAVTGECKKVMKGHTDIVSSAAYSPDGREFVSASVDNTIKVWNANDSRETYSYSLPSSCYAATFSPDGRTIAVACEDGNIYLIDFPPLQELIDQTRERFKNSPLTPEERRQYYLE